jgi:hypothetical protein
MKRFHVELTYCGFSPKGDLIKNMPVIRCRTRFRWVARVYAFFVRFPDLTCPIPYWVEADIIEY